MSPKDSKPPKDPESKTEYKTEKGTGAGWISLTKPDDGGTIAIRIDKLVAIEDYPEGTKVMYDSRVGASVVSVSDSADDILDVITEEIIVP